MNSIKRNTEDVLRALEMDGFKIAAGNTSNCVTSYNISAVAETVSGVVLLILMSKWNGRWATTPIEFTQNRGDKYKYVALSNFGTPQVSSIQNEMDALEDNIGRFNYEVEPCESLSFSRLERIAKIVTKDGEEISFI